jgi:hypothetical protein
MAETDPSNRPLQYAADARDDDELREHCLQVSPEPCRRCDGFLSFLVFTNWTSETIKTRLFQRQRKMLFVVKKRPSFL